jgi:trehalose 6-phosphate synthase
VAAQNPFDPGVLVLSSFAGAAKQLDAAVLVNPHDIDGMARQIGKALVMSLEERRERWQSMVRTLRRSSVQNWFSDFLTALTGVHHAPAPSVVQSPAMVPSTFDLAGASRAARSY